VNRRRRELIRSGIDDFVAHRLAYFFPGLVSVFIVCGVFSLIGYAFDHSSSFGESKGAGTGLLVGLAVWLVILGWFIASGGGRAIRDRRRERRRQKHIREVRSRRLR